MITKIIEKSNLSPALEIIKKGGLVAFPTETVYGLGASIFQANACLDIYKTKGRPPENPLITHIASKEQLMELVSPAPNTLEILEKLINTFSPGPLTYILPKSELIGRIGNEWVCANLPTIGVRIPRNEIAKDFLQKLNEPVAAPSANISGRPSSTSFEMVFSQFNGKIEGIIQGDDSEIGLESTIISFEDKNINILRFGFITTEMLQNIAGGFGFEIKVMIKGKLAAPGMHFTHYQPKTKLLLFKNVSEIENLEIKEKTLIISTQNINLKNNHNIELKIYKTLDEYMFSLYKDFFYADKNGFSLILSQITNHNALNDRLSRASGDNYL